MKTARAHLIRELGGLHGAQPVGTENGHAVLVAGRPVPGFFARASSRLRCRGLARGALRRTGPRGGSWGSGGDIVFAPQATGGLFRVSAEGGEPAEVVHTDASRKETGLRFPQFLPDGKQFMFVSMPQRQGSYEIFLASLASKDRVSLMRAGAAPVWADPDYLVTMRNQRLVVQRFDLAVEISSARAGDRDARRSVARRRPAGIGLEERHPAYRRRGVQHPGVLVRPRRQAWSTLSLAKGRWETVTIAPDGRRALSAPSPPRADWWLVDLNTARASFRGSVCSSWWVVPVQDQSSSSRAYPVLRHLPQAGRGGRSRRALVVSDVLFKNLTGLTACTFDQPDPETAWDIWRGPLAGSASRSL
jgi:hypothetical protein